MLPVWLKALLFVGGGTIAAAGAAYVTGALDPWFGKQPAVIAAVPPATQPQTTTAPAQQQPAVKDEPKAEEPAKTTEVPLPSNDPVTTQKDDRLAAPSFDLLRVEGDGSVVIAGKAPAKARVEVMHGDKVLAEAAANADGDFVAVFDEALAPGDYVLSLRATTPDNETTASTETAIVAVPETKGGQVLAMVEQPGAPATLLTVPQAPATTGETQDATAPAAAEEEKPADVAAAPASEEPKQEEAATTEAPAATTETPAQAGSEQVAAASESTEQSAPAATEQPAAEQSRVVVEAVEIEGDTIFVAGFATAGYTVRVYADEIVIGEAVASEGGRFLVEAKRDLPVGSYVIRADLLTRDGAVVARAAVPFEREEGESIAAVAAQPQAEAPKPAETSSTEPAEQEEASAPAQTEEKPATETAAQEAPAASQPAETSVPAAVAAAEPAKEEAMTAAPLQRADGSVIIRRGDSLWRISRRVYGQGIRYSTIYLANQDQIQNPDRIWPGQVFAVPRETAEGEKADMDAISEQAVAPGEKSAQ